MEEGLYRIYRETMISWVTSRAERETFAPGYRFGPHSHSSVEMILLLEGNCVCTAGKKRIALQAQEYLVFLSNTPHSFAAEEEAPCTCLHLHFHPEWFVQVMTRSLGPMEQKLFWGAEYLRYPSSEAMVRCLRELLEEQEESALYWEENAGLLLCQILLLIARDHQAAAQQKEQSYSRPVKAAVDYIDQHYDEKLTLPQIAESCYVSPPYLSRLFYQCTHTSILEYVKVVKVRKAAHRIAAEEVSLTALALDLGFSSVQHFSKTFKEITGMSPREFRDSIRRTAQYAARLPKDEQTVCAAPPDLRGNRSSF